MCCHVFSTIIMHPLANLAKLLHKGAGSDFRI
jgi:hypothetical protein